MSFFKSFGFPFVLLLSFIGLAPGGSIPADYKGKPFMDATHTTGPQKIPGRLEAALYDLGGEGVSYHDTEATNFGSGVLNHQQGHCEPGVSPYICNFRENEGVDISYVKKLADLNHPNMVRPEWQQLYIGWTKDGEWTNYTVEVEKAGTYRIVVMYTYTAQTVSFSLNDQPAADCKLPVDPSKELALKDVPGWVVWHIWNQADCGEIHFPHTGRQLLTFHYKQGNNFAYFDFVPANK